MSVAALIAVVVVLLLISQFSRPAARQLPAAAASSYQAPRTVDGRPNLNGIWQVLATAAWDIQDHQARNGVPAGQGVVEGNEIPYQTWAAEKKKENFERRMTADPETKCYLPGVPRGMYMPFPFEIMQTPAYVVIASEYLHATRTIYLDGRTRQASLPRFWMGDSRGRWEGDTLVVDVANFTDQTWFDRAGNFHSDALQLVERFTPTGPGTMAYEVTITDPKVFTRPWKMRMPFYRRVEKDVQLLEYECYSYLEDEYLADQAKKKKK